MRWLASIRRPSLRARIIRSSAERVWIVCVREKKRKKKSGEMFALQGTWWIKEMMMWNPKEKTARCCAPLLHGHISQPEGEYNRKKEERINHGWTKKERDSSLLPFNQFFDRPIFIFSFLLYRPSSVMLIPYFFCPCVYILMLYTRTPWWALYTSPRRI